MKKGDRVQSHSVGGHHCVVLKVHRKAREATVLFGINDNRKFTKRVPWSDLFVTLKINTAEIPQTTNGGTSEGLEVPRLETSGDGEVDVREGYGRVAFPRPRRSGDS